MGNNKHTGGQPLILRRYIAGFIDYALISGLDYVYLMTFGVSDGEGGYRAEGFMALPPTFLWFFLTVGLEQALGATIGNGIAGVKVIQLGKEFEEKPSFVQSLKRHLADPIDMFLFGLVAVITIKNSQYKQRLGDVWANTIVIIAKN